MYFVLRNSLGWFLSMLYYYVCDYINISINHFSVCAWRVVSSFILTQKSGGGEEGGKLFTYDEMAKMFTFCPVLQSVQEGDLWSLEKMQAYFCHVKSLKPIMTEAANQYVH